MFILLKMNIVCAAAGGYNQLMQIRKVPGVWKIENTRGISRTYEDAVARLRAIKARQRASRKNK